jgi:hypothetical protein
MVIKSFLPNPIGKDTDGEIVTLFNNSDQTVSMAGWYLKDASGKSYSLSGVIEPNSELVLPYRTSKISLNNNGETVYLYDQNNSLIDQLSYVGTADEGMLVDRSIAKDGLQGGAEFFENWPRLSGIVNQQSNFPQFFIIMFIVALIFASLGVYAYRELYRDQKGR